MRFYDREVELAQLARTTAGAFRRGGRLTVVTGRRRVGKTELLRRHMAGIRERGLYLFVGRRHPSLLKEEFARAAASRFPELGGAEYRRVADLIRALLVLSSARPLLLVLDEFQNFVHVEPSFYSDLQDAWDELHQRVRCHLVVAGSTFSLMTRVFEDRKEPLYGRATDRLAVEPLTPSVTRQILSDHNRSRHLLFFRAVFGGIPRYYELIDKHGLWRAPPERLLSELVFSRSGILYREGHDLLMEEFGREHQSYFAVLSAVARGNTQLSRVADAVAMPSTSAGKYLDELQSRYELIERRTPVLDTRTRRGLYRLRDPFLSFWFRYVHRNASFLEVGRVADVVEQVRADLPNFLGPAFETLCRDVLTERTRRGEKPLGLVPDYIGGWWDRRGHEVDVVVGNGSEAVLVECKLSAGRLSRGAAAGFHEGAAAFCASHPGLAVRRVAVSLDRPRASDHAACSRHGIELLAFDDLWTR